MTQGKFTFLLIALSMILFSCKKESAKDKPVTIPVEFTSTVYRPLGTYDSNGKPSYLLPRNVISSDLLSFINTNLPPKQDLRTTHPELLTTKAIADIAISKKSDVFITYVMQDGGFTNTFSFYTYPTNQKPASTADIKEVVYVFPNAGSRNPLKPGDNVKIGTFEAGTSIGFLILQKGWSVDTHSINNKTVHFCSNDVLNPEVDPNLKKHAVIIDYAPENKVLIGFEDTDRTDPKCDHDFNDVVFYATVNPI